MSSLELVIRAIGATAALILGLGFLGARGAPWSGRWCGALLCLGVIGYLACSADWRICSQPSALPISMLASGIPFFFWGWARSTMDDDFEFGWLPLVLGGTLVCMPLATGPLCPAEYVGWSVAIHSGLGIAFIVAALIAVVRTWREDLIEARRRMRWIVLVVAGVYSIIVMFLEFYYRNQTASPALQLLNAVSLTVLLLTLCGTMLSVSDQMRSAFGWTSETDPAIPSEQEPVQPAPVVSRDVDQELVDRLQAAMTDKGTYRDAELTVSALAQKLGVAEKRLREIINGRLGHKNFPSFVNAYRLEEVRQRLGDARHDHLPILTLALDAGFGSIVVFNRVFKERFTMTPTEYRAARRGAAAAG